MIKGVNKQILEMTNPESPYFERIIFFVRPEGQAAKESRLNSEAARIASQAGKPPRVKGAVRRQLAGALYGLLGVGAGAALMFLMQHWV